MRKGRIVSAIFIFALIALVGAIGFAVFRNHLFRSGSGKSAVSSTHSPAGKNAPAVIRPGNIVKPREPGDISASLSSAAKKERVRGSVPAAVTGNVNRKDASRSAIDRKMTAEDKAYLAKNGILCNSSRSISVLRRDPAVIFLRNAIIDTAAIAQGGESIEAQIPEQYRAGTNNTHHIVLFDQPLSDAQKELLKGAGAVVENYLPNRAFAVTADAQALEKIKGLSGVVYVEPFHPYFKLSREVQALLVGTGDLATAVNAKSGSYNAMLFSGSDAAARLEALGAKVKIDRINNSMQIARIECSSEKLAEIAQLDSVKWIEAKPVIKVMNDIANKTTRAKAVKLGYPGLDGSGVTVGVCDTGVDDTHRGFARDPNQATSYVFTNNTRIAYYEARPGPSDDGIIGDTAGHGSHVSGSILGNGGLSATVPKAPGSGLAPYLSNQFAGMATNANLVMLEDFNSFTSSEITSIAYNHGARLMNHSWGANLPDYGVMSAEFDALVRDADPGTAGNQQLTLFFAAGNNGQGEPNGVGGIAQTVGQPGNAKNVITVGAVEQRRLCDNLPNYGSVQGSDSGWQVSSFSSRGPTPDERIKPDILAPGDFVMSVQSKDVNFDIVEYPSGPDRDFARGNLNSGPNYAVMSGTSMACPLATGCGTLLYQYYTNTYSKAPSPAMMKALMVSGAMLPKTFVYDMALLGALNPPPPIIYAGWGMIDLVQTIDGPRCRATDEIIASDELYTVATGQFNEIPLEVTGDDEGGLKVTMAYTDFPGTPGAGVALVNDIDLSVTDPNGITYHGNCMSKHIWGMASEPSPFYNINLVDGLNPVENVIVRHLKKGTWKIRVEGFNVPNGPQNYALVIVRGASSLGDIGGSEPVLALNSQNMPVLATAIRSGEGATADPDLAAVRRWVGGLGASGELATWRQMREKWFDYGTNLESEVISGVIPGDKVHETAVAVDRSNDKVYAAWRYSSFVPGTPDSIYLRYWNGTNWTQLGGSYQNRGVCDEDNTASAFCPAVGVGSDRNPVVVYIHPYLDLVARQQYQEVIAKKWNGTAWVSMGTNPRSAIEAGAYATSLSMVSDDSGNCVVVWRDLRALKLRCYKTSGSGWVKVGGDLGTKPDDTKPKVAVNGSSVYVTWVEYPQDASHPLQTARAAVSSGGAWADVGGATMGYPGFSGTNGPAYNPQIGVAGSTVYMAWQESTGIYLKTCSGSTFGGLNGSASNSIVNVGGTSTLKSMVVHPLGLPIFAVENDQSGAIETLIFGYVGSVEPAPFRGISTATGTASNTVDLTWARVISPEVIEYYVYRFGGWPASSTNIPLASDPATIAAVFASAPTLAGTDISQYTYTGLAANQNWYFGVRTRNQSGLWDSNNKILLAGPYSLEGDQDADWLTAQEELSISNVLAARGLRPIPTSPSNPDTDGDGMWDGWEFYYSNINTGQYYYAGTSLVYSLPAHTNEIFTNVFPGIDASTNFLYLNPFDNGVSDMSQTSGVYYAGNQGRYDDLDGDGLMNIEEFSYWQGHHWVLDFTTITNARSAYSNWALDPTNPDSDRDGIPDGWEMMNGLDPGNPSDATNLLDGVTFLDKYLQGGSVSRTDSDGDGISDSNELYVVGTSLGSADTDNDGLEDGFEANVTGSNPVRADSNGDGVSDGDTYQIGYNNPLTAPKLVNIITNVNFESGFPAGWTNYSPAINMWHLTSTDPDPPSASAPIYIDTHTTNRSMRCARDASASPGVAGTNLSATYDANGDRVVSYMSPPAFSAAGMINLYISWNEYYETEAQKDKCMVEASVDNGANWEAVRIGVSGVSEGWVRRTADLSKYAGSGSVTVRFLFDTYDGINNAFRGWWVDDVMIYSATRISGHVREESGEPLNNAVVYAIGRGGVTNTIGSHKYVLPGKIMGVARTAADGYYQMDGLAQGKYHLKAAHPGYKAEFWNGVLYDVSIPYYTAFGRQINPGVNNIRRVDPVNGFVDLTVANSSTNCDFELERGISRGSVGVLMPSENLPVYLDQPLTNYTMWNGVTNAAGLAWVPYLTTNLIATTFPDWETNNVDNQGAAGRPSIMSDVDEGAHILYLPSASNMPYISRMELTVRDAEETIIKVETNAFSGKIYVYADDIAIPIYIDSRNTGLRTASSPLIPVVISVLAGEHEVVLRPDTTNRWVSPKLVDAPKNDRCIVRFSSGEMWGSTSILSVETVDTFDNSVVGAAVLVDGSIIASNDISSTTLTTPVTLKALNVGNHYITVMKEGYRQSPRQPVYVYSNTVNSLRVVLYDSDRDYDGVGDSLEIESYTNIFTYSGSDDPDQDGLSNLLEFKQYELHNMRMLLFDPDTDHDGMRDGDELGFDGKTNRLSLSTLWAGCTPNDTSVKVRFAGSFLAGTNAFNTNRIASGNMYVSVAGDMFRVTNLVWRAGDYSAPVMDFGVTAYGYHDIIVNNFHTRDDMVNGDTYPTVVDTENDGMWDGFEFKFMGVGELNPIEAGAQDNDPDHDGLSNIREFLGYAKTASGDSNKWCNPGNPDTDGDGIPDGWEIDWGLNPTDNRDAASDLDNDGLVNIEEWQWGTSPTNTDSDFDGLIDGLEVHTYHTQPLVWDTDDDGLSDGQEVWDTEMNYARHNGGFFPNWNGGDMDNDGLVDGPTDWDTDGGGLPDGFEVEDPYLLGSASNPFGIRPTRLDPSNPNDDRADSDNDGLSNLEEFMVRDAQFGHHPSEFARQQQQFVIYEERDGIVVVEMESNITPVDNWTFGTSVAGYYPFAPLSYNFPAGYYTWNGTIFGSNAPDRVEAPDRWSDVDTMGYLINITNDWGTNYVFELRHSHPSAVVSTQDQVWVSIDYGDWLTATNSGGQNNTWTYNTTLIDTNSGAPVVVTNIFLDVGWHFIRFSGLSAGNSLDRFILYDAGGGVALRNVARANDPYASQATMFDDVIWDFSTDPFNPDTDGDGLPDGWEVMHGLHPVDPIRSPDPAFTNGIYDRFSGYGLGLFGDLDNDGVMNWCEYAVRFNQNPNADRYAIQGSTDPWKVDTDGDGLEDAEEIKAFASNPLNQDTDNDGLRDGGADPSIPAEVDTGATSANVNQYDKALNDMWHMVLPKGEVYPLWVQDSTNRIDPNYPAPRWGGGYASVGYKVGDDAAGTYVGRASTSGAGLTEAKQALIATSASMVFGGRDGVRHFDEAWETRQPNPTATNWINRGIIPGMASGDSELVVVQKSYAQDTYDPKFPTRRPRPGGPAGYQFYNGIVPSESMTWEAADDEVDAEGNPSPPTATRNNWSEIFVLCGWDQQHVIGGGGFGGFVEENGIPGYVLARYYHPDDNTNIILHFAWLCGSESQWESTAGAYDNSVGYTADRDVLDTVFIGPHVAGVGVTNGYTGINFPQVLNSRFDLGTLSSISATVTMSCINTSELPVCFRIYGELRAINSTTAGNNARHANLSSAASYGDPVLGSKVLGPRKRRSAAWGYASAQGASTLGFISPSVAETNIDTGEVVYTPSRVVVNVTTQVLEMLRSNISGTFEHGNNMGFVMLGVIDSAGTYAIDGGRLKLQGERLDIRIKTPPYLFCGATRGAGNWISPVPPPFVPFPHRRKSTAACFTGSEYILFGGVNELQAMSDTWYSPAPMAGWTQCTNFPVKPPGRWGHGMANVPGGIVVFGGFSSNNVPLNDLWFLGTTSNGVAETWVKVTLADNEIPPPRGGMTMGNFAGFACMFGGTDNKKYFNDTWVIDTFMPGAGFDPPVAKWLCISPNGERSAGPSPRAFACSSGTMNIFGGRTGTLPGGTDTDSDGLEDKLELELGGSAAGRDPRVNALIPETAFNNTNGIAEKLPYSFLMIGGVNAQFMGFSRATVAEFESLEYGSYAFGGMLPYNIVVPFEGHKSPYGAVYYDVGYTAYSADDKNLWYHRFAGQNPYDPRDVWELGVPHSENLTSNAAPPTAHSGRWCMGTRLNGYYPDNASMDLYSPVFGLRLPTVNSTSANTNRFFLTFFEWLDLADSHDVVNVEVVRPSTPADIRNRQEGLTPPRPTIPILANRNNAYNTAGEWRKVVVPLDQVANETNLFLKFSLQSDAVGHAGGWYIDDVAIIQGGVVSGSYTNNGLIYLFARFATNSLASVTNSAGRFGFELVVSGDYRVITGNGIPSGFSSIGGAGTWDVVVQDLQANDIVMGITVNSPAHLTWNSIAGVTYAVQYTTPSLLSTANPWVTLATVTATGTTSSYIDLGADTAPSRFYRVVLLGVLP